MKLHSKQILQFSLAAILGLVGEQASASTVGFTGQYAPINWTLVTTNNTGVLDNSLVKRDGTTPIRADGDIDVFAPIGNAKGEMLDLWSSSPNVGTADWRIPITPLRAGTIKFDWSFESLDTDGNNSGLYFDPSTNQFQTLATAAGVTSSLFKAIVTVNQGDTFAFRAQKNIANGAQGILTVRNFEFQPVPFEFSPALGIASLGAMGVFNAIRKSVKVKKG